MIGFHPVNWGTSEISLSAILSIGAPRNDQYDRLVRVVRLTDARTFDLSDYGYEQLMGRPVQIMPVPAGTFLLTHFLDDEEAEVELYVDPIIAWALCADGEVRPVTTEGVNGGRGLYPPNGQFVQHADGQITASGSEADRSSFAGREEFVSYWLAIRQRERDEITARDARQAAAEVPDDSVASSPFDVDAR